MLTTTDFRPATFMPEPFDAVRIRRADRLPDWRAARHLLREYVESIQRGDEMPVPDLAILRADGRSPALSFAMPNRMFIASAYPHGDDDHIGCAGLRVSCVSAELTRLYVQPRAQGQGAARALLLAAIADVKARGIARIHLDVHPEGMPAAFHIFRDLGFAVTGTTPGFDGVVAMELRVLTTPT